MKKNLILIVLPVLYLLLAIYFRNLTGDLSLRSIDPEYIYFISGLSMGNGIPDVAHVDNPGTPLQVLAAIIFRLVWILKGCPQTFTENVLLNSDAYLSILSLSLAGILSLFLFIAGKKTYSTTRNLPLSLLIQTSTCIPGIWFSILGRVTPELLFPIPAILLTLLLLHYLHPDKNKIDSDDENKMALKFALISALGLSIKLTWTPLIFIAPILLTNWKSRLRYFIILALSFALFAFPAMLKFNNFKNWIKNLFLHSGRYGQGENNVIDVDVFLQGLWDTIRIEPWFILTLIIVSGITTYRVFNLKKHQTPVLKLSLALYVCAIIQVLIVAKHFEHRYLLPSVLLLPVLFYLLLKNLQEIISLKWQFYLRNNVLILLVLFQIIRCIPHGITESENIRTDISAKRITSAFISKLPDQRYLVISTQAYGCPFPEYHLMYSISWAGAESKLYSEELKKHFPNTCLYFTWDKSLRHWGDLPDLEKLSASEIPVYIYLEKRDTILLSEVILKTMPDIKFENILLNPIFFNPKTGEYIAEIKLRKSS